MVLPKVIEPESMTKYSSMNLHITLKSLLHSRAVLTAYKGITQDIHKGETHGKGENAKTEIHCTCVKASLATD